MQQQYSELVQNYHSTFVQSPHFEGKMLIATQDLEKGVIVEKFEGQTINYTDVPEDKICIAIYVGNNNGTNKWIVSDTNAIYANHSCDPNCIIDDDLHIVTIRPVKKGEELTYSYNILEKGEKTEDFFWDPRWNFECKCNSKKCRKNIDTYIEMN